MSLDDGSLTFDEAKVLWKRNLKLMRDENLVIDRISALVDDNGFSALQPIITNGICITGTTDANEARRQQSACIRVNSAQTEFAIAAGVLHPTNGDEQAFPNRIGNFSKGLPHDVYGEVNPVAYNKLLYAVQTTQPQDYANIPLGCPGGRKLTNPQAGLAFDMVGADTHALTMPIPYSITTQTTADQAVELYWMALSRDVLFTDYATNPITLAAAAELTGLSAFDGPRDMGVVTSGTLFRGPWSGCLDGPFISQFLYLDCPYGATYIDQQFQPATAGLDYMTVYNDWLNIQNGCLPGSAPVLDPTPRYMINLRDLTRWVQIDQLNQAFVQAALVLTNLGAPLSPTNPYNNSANQMGFATFGGPHLLRLIGEVCVSLKDVWYQKWCVHRYLRPEAYGGLVHLNLTGQKTYPLNSDVLTSTAVSQTFGLTGTYLLPQAYPEGSPLHPSYGSGHATVAGACVALLKAWFDESWVIPAPVQPNNSGSALIPYVGPPLTVGGELNKLADNIATGRNAAGIHWRQDGNQGNILGESSTISVLRDFKNTYNENFLGFTFTSFANQQIVI